MHGRRSRSYGVPAWRRVPPITDHAVMAWFTHSIVPVDTSMGETAMVQRMSFHRWLIVSALAVALAIAAGAGLDRVWAQSTSGPTATASVGSAKLLAKGAGIAVTLQVSCTGFSEVESAGAYLSVQQRVSGKQIAYGEGGEEFGPIICDGSTQTTPSIVLSPTAGVSFKKGQAVIRVNNFRVCGFVENGGEYNGFQCIFTDSVAEVHIR